MVGNICVDDGSLIKDGVHPLDEDELDFVWPADLDSSASLVEEASHWINDSMRELQHHHSRLSWKKEEIGERLTTISREELYTP